MEEIIANNDKLTSEVKVLREENEELKYKNGKMNDRLQDLQENVYQEGIIHLLGSFRKAERSQTRNG